MRKKSKKIMVIGLVMMMFILSGCSLTDENTNDTGYTEILGGENVNNSLGISTEEEMSDETLWELINGLPIYVEKTGALPSILQSDCLLSAIFWNNSGVDIRDVTIAYLAWDRNGLPLLLDYDLWSEKYTYCISCDYTGINMLNGTSYGEGTGVQVRDVATSDVAIVSAVMVRCTDFNGNEFYNPYYEIWLSKYYGKKI